MISNSNFSQNFEQNAQNIQTKTKQSISGLKYSFIKLSYRDRAYTLNKMDNFSLYDFSSSGPMVDTIRKVLTSFREQLNYPHFQFFELRLGGETAGLMSLDFDSYSLYQRAVAISGLLKAPKFIANRMHKEIGSLLLDEAIRIANEKGLEKIYVLSVSEQSTAFYLKNNFKIVNRESDPYLKEPIPMELNIQNMQKKTEEVLSEEEKSIGQKSKLSKCPEKYSLSHDVPPIYDRRDENSKLVGKEGISAPIKTKEEKSIGQKTKLSKCPEKYSLSHDVPSIYDRRDENSKLVGKEGISAPIKTKLDTANTNLSQLTKKWTFKITPKRFIFSDDKVKTELILGILISSGLTAYFANLAYQCTPYDRSSQKIICIDLQGQGSVDECMLSAGICGLSTLVFTSILINYVVNKRL